MGRVLISVSDKRGLAPFAARLAASGVEILASGGTAEHLRAHGVEVTEVASVTGAPEMLGGRVKTLHPAIHGAILADRGRREHRSDLDERSITPIDLVVVNLYPFAETVVGGAADEEVVEQIDIGGPTLIRAAAKNRAWVGVVVSPDRYEIVAAAVESGGLDAELRRDLAREAFFHTAEYDAAIVAWLEPDEIPDRLIIPLEVAGRLRYGENPHQPGALYRVAGSSPWWDRTKQHQGKEMSFNNYIDCEAAWRLAMDLEPPSAVVVKHTNACGAASAGEPAVALRTAWECDPLSAFGGVVAVNATVDARAASEVADRFIEVLIAPGYSGEALEILGARPSLRVLEAPPPASTDLDFRRIEGGFVAQARDAMEGVEAWRVVSDREPSAAEMEDLWFGALVAASTKSNAIVIVKDRAAVGVGAGDQSRVGAAERALVRAGERSKGAIAASDAFIPFGDAVEVLAAAGVTTIVQPGGSVRDQEVVATANEVGVAMVMTDRRHFRH